MDSFEVVVVGAGVVGLAIARALSRSGREVLLLEREGAYGQGTSSRNSEVIHAGLYYAPGSLKAALCVRGRELLYRYCAERGVPHRRCGKLIVATRPEDEAALQAIATRAAACGAHDLQPLDGADARRREPALAAAAALWSPSTGIVDSHGLMTALLGDAESAGALLATRSPFEWAEALPEGWLLQAGGTQLRCRWLINAAGLAAHAVAQRMHGLPLATVPRRHWAKGHYFALAGRSPFSHLIYPTPVDGGLGVHLTLDLAGAARFGPDVEWLPTPPDDDRALDFAVDPGRRAAFEADIRRYWPGLPDGALQPAYTGVRPKLSGPGEPAADFRIAGPSELGVGGTVQLFGIESPGLTASLAIAERVASIVGNDG